MGWGGWFHSSNHAYLPSEWLRGYPSSDAPPPPPISPFRRGIKKRVSLQAEQQRQPRGLSLMSCHPRAAVSSEPVAEQIKTVPRERGGGREGGFNTSAKIGPRGSEWVLSVLG